MNLWTAKGGASCWSLPWLWRPFYTGLIAHVKARPSASRTSLQDCAGRFGTCSGMGNGRSRGVQGVYEFFTVVSAGVKRAGRPIFEGVPNG